MVTRPRLHSQVASDLSEGRAVGHLKAVQMTLFLGLRVPTSSGNHRNEDLSHLSAGCADDGVAIATTENRVHVYNPLSMVAYIRT